MSGRPAPSPFVERIVLKLQQRIDRLTRETEEGARRAEATLAAWAKQGRTPTASELAIHNRSVGIRAAELARAEAELERLAAKYDLEGEDQ